MANIGSIITLPVRLMTRAPVEVAAFAVALSVRLGARTFRRAVSGGGDISILAVKVAWVTLFTTGNGVVGVATNFFVALGEHVFDGVYDICLSGKSDTSESDAVRLDKVWYVGLADTSRNPPNILLLRSPLRSRFDGDSQRVVDLPTDIRRTR